MPPLVFRRVSPLTACRRSELPLPLPQKPFPLGWKTLYNADDVTFCRWTNIMTAPSMSRMVLLAFVAACGIALVFAIQRFGREPPVETKAATAAPAVSKPASGARDQGANALAAAQAKADAMAAALDGSRVPPDSDDSVPTFDVARIEPTGGAVIAGRTTPGATVELLRNGELHDRAVADQSGQFVMVPPRLPSGTYDLTLRSTQPDGKQATSSQSVAVAIEPGATDRPVVALMTPGKPIVVLSQPPAPRPTTGAVVLESVEIEPGGKFHTSGRAHPGGAVRLYLNDAFVAAATAGTDGSFTVTINEGVAPGRYRVRLDEVESNSGAVRARAEVPFYVPDTMVTASVPAQPTASERPDIAAGQQPQLAAAAATVLPDGGSPSTVVVPKIATTTVSRGDSLWRLSRYTYGVGTRYAVIYKANREQIRNPNLIRPGQIFVLPAREK
jgi:nucleoid-associated protein YgaU